MSEDKRLYSPDSPTDKLVMQIKQVIQEFVSETYDVQLQDFHFGELSMYYPQDISTYAGRHMTGIGISGGENYPAIEVAFLYPRHILCLFYEEAEETEERLTRLLETITRVTRRSCRGYSTDPDIPPGNRRWRPDPISVSILDIMIQGVL